MRPTCAHPAAVQSSGSPATVVSSMLSSALVRSVLDSLPDAMIIIDSTGHILFANHQVTELFGHANAAIVGVDRILLARIGRNSPPELDADVEDELRAYYYPDIARLRDEFQLDVDSWLR